MGKQDILEFKGQVIDLLPNAMFRVKLENDHIIIAHTSGKLSEDSHNELVLLFSKWKKKICNDEGKSDLV